jgi:hypothetical protein
VNGSSPSPITMQSIKRNVLAQYPTTIRRSVCLKNLVEIDHSVIPWLYRRWLATATVEQELSALQWEMRRSIIDYANNESLRVVFSHLNPVAISHATTRLMCAESISIKAQKSQLNSFKHQL